MGKPNLKLGCLVYPCFSCSTFLFTEKSLHKDFLSLYFDIFTRIERLMFSMKDITQLI